jgi:hypothetical protein
MLALILKGLPEIVRVRRPMRIGDVKIITMF